MIRTLDYLKSRFEQFDKPNQQDFTDLIDTLAQTGQTTASVPAGTVPYGKSDGTSGASTELLAYNESSHAFAVGLQCLANGRNAFAQGFRTYATHDNSVAFGASARTRRDAEFVWAGNHSRQEGDAQTVLLAFGIGPRTNNRATILIADGETLVCEWLYADSSGTGATGKVLLKNLAGALTIRPNGTETWDGFLNMSIASNGRGGVDFIPALENDATPSGHLSLTCSSALAR